MRVSVSLLFIPVGCTDGSNPISPDELPDLSGTYTGSIHCLYPPLPADFLNRHRDFDRLGRGHDYNVVAEVKREHDYLIVNPHLNRVSRIASPSTGRFRFRGHI